MLVAISTIHCAASGGPGSTSQSVPVCTTPSFRAMSQFALPLADGPCVLNAWFGETGAGPSRQNAVAITQAWTSMPCACALSISVCNGSNGNAAPPAWSRRGPEARWQKQSPRRTTCATIAFRCAAFVAATIASIRGASNRSSPKASTQYARNWPPGGGAASNSADFDSWGSRASANAATSTNPTFLTTSVTMKQGAVSREGDFSSLSYAGDAEQ